MQMVTQLNPTTIQTYGNLSSYVYLHIPQSLCKQFGIVPSSQFAVSAVSYRDGRLILEQIKEDKDAQLGAGSTEK